MTRELVAGPDLLIDAGANPITNVEDPTNDQDAATKKYVDDNTGAGVVYGTPAVVLGTVAGNGSVDEAIRRDSTIVAFDATAPTTQAFGDSAATGSAAVAARRDHKHAMPATPTSVSGNAGTATALQTGRTIDGQTFDGTANITVIAPGTHAASSKTTPVDADELALVDTEASNVLKKLTGTNLKAYLKAYFDTLYTGSGTGIASDGWQSTSGFSYSSADAPTFVIATSSDLSGTIPVGARIKLTQTTPKYFIVTAISATTITVYGGTDYTLANASITSPSWSNIKAPFGFPQDPAKWTVTTTSTSDCAKSSPTTNTWYGGSGLSATGPSIDIPIGAWRVEYKATLDVSATNPAGQITLSTANNSESDNKWTQRGQIGSSGARWFASFFLSGFITVASKTTHFLNIRVLASATSVDIRGDSETTVIRAVCAYL